MQPRFSEQIKQIIPAHEGYYAVLLDGEEPYYHLERIVGWALVEFEDADSERQTRIAGLSLFSSGVWFADNTKEFFEYVHEDQLTQRHERFRNQGRKYADDPEGYGSSKSMPKREIEEKRFRPRLSRRRSPSSVSAWRTSENPLHANLREPDTDELPRIHLPRTL